MHQTLSMKITKHNSQTKHDYKRKNVRKTLKVFDRKYINIHIHNIKVVIQIKDA